MFGRGRYALGPDKKFLKYQADSHHETLDSLGVFSAGSGSESVGLEFRVDVDYTFWLKKDQVGELHRELASNYETIIVSRCKDAIKNEAANVPFNEYFQNRTNVEQRFRDAVQDRWDQDPPLHCTLDQFHLGRIAIPEAVAEKQLQASIQNERNEMEASKQQAAVERELTAVEVNRIQLEKEKLLRTARAQASLLRANARAEATQIVQSAESNGTELLFNAAGFTGQEQIIAFSYIRTLSRRAGNLEIDVSYLSDENVLRTVPVN